MTASTQIRGSEPVVAALVQRLTDEIEDAIDAINATVDDGYEVEYPVQVLDYAPPLEGLNDFPTIGIVERQGTFEDDTGFSATGRYELAIVCLIQDSDQQGLIRRQRRSQLAIVRCALRDRRLDPGWGTGLVRFEPGPALGEIPDADSPPSAWYTWTSVVIWVKADED